MRAASKRKNPSWLASLAQIGELACRLKKFKKIDFAHEHEVCHMLCLTFDPVTSRVNALKAQVAQAGKYMTMTQLKHGYPIFIKILPYL